MKVGFSLLFRPRDWFCRVGSRKRDVVVFTVVVVACLISISPVRAQSCPASIDRFQLIFPPLAYSTELPVNQIRCKPGDDGGKFCQLRCPYRVMKPPTNDLVNFVTIATWFVESPPKPSSTMCGGRVQSNVLASAGRMATVTVSVTLDDIKVPETQPAINRAAAILLPQAEQNALPCPGAVSSGGIPRPEVVDNSSACRQNFARLSELRAKESQISEQLSYLRNHDKNEKANRDALSLWNKTITSLNTAGPDGPTDWVAKKLVESQAYRDGHAAGWGLANGMTDLALARAIRDQLVAQIDYLKDAPEFIARFTHDKVAVDIEIAKIRTAMTNLQCGGRFDNENCDLSGKWVLNFQDGPQPETWEFLASAPGKYNGQNEHNGWKGEAEVFGKEVVLRWQGIKDLEIASSQFSGRHHFKLVDSCQTGNGNRTVGPLSPEQFLIRRAPATKVLLLPDKLYEVSYDGRVYSGIYKRDMHNGVPIDLFYFKIVNEFGIHISQDGELLWGKFVRVPAFDHPEQGNVEWWFANWVRDGDRWKPDSKRGVTVVIK